MNKLYFPKVSVIIPTYNCARYLPEAINSVLNQTYQDLEIIVVDDGSTDNTRTITGEYIDKFSEKIRYFYQENKGPGAARNIGIQQAKGEYICFLDADDLILSGSINKRINFFEKNRELTMVFSDFTLNFDSSEIINANLRKNNFLNLLNGSIESKNNNEIILNSKFLIDFFKRNMPVWTGTVMIKKIAIEKIGAFKENMRISEDLDFWWRTIKHYQKIGYIDEPLSFYRRTRGTLCKNIENLYSGTIDFLTGVLNEVTNNKELLEIKNTLRKRLSSDLLELGREYLRKSKIKKAKKCFFRSLRYNPLNYSVIIFIALTYIPVSIQRNLRKIKAVLKNMSFKTT